MRRHRYKAVFSDGHEMHCALERTLEIGWQVTAYQGSMLRRKTGWASSHAEADKRSNSVLKQFSSTTAFRDARRELVKAVEYER